MNIQRIMAIFEKDLKDFMKNTMLVFMPFIPLILAIMYSNMSGDEEMPLLISYLVVGTTFASVTAALMMMMMAEENEKKTLRGLIMSPASFLDIIIGKSLVTALLTWLTLIVSLLILGIDPFLSVRIMLGLFLLFLFFLFLGIGVGFFVKSVGATTPYFMPIMFIFGFTPMIEFFGLSETSVVLKVADKLPISQLMVMHDNASWLPLGIVFLWVLGAVLFAYVCFIRTRRDD